MGLILFGLNIKWWCPLRQYCYQRNRIRHRTTSWAVNILTYWLLYRPGRDIRDTRETRETQGKGAGRGSKKIRIKSNYPPKKLSVKFLWVIEYYLRFIYTFNSPYMHQFTLPSTLETPFPLPPLSSRRTLGRSQSTWHPLANKTTIIKQISTYKQFNYMSRHLIHPVLLQTNT